MRKNFGEKSWLYPLPVLIIGSYDKTLECEMVSYDEDTEIMGGRIINVSAEETISTDGKIDRTELDLIAVDLVSWDYVRQGEPVGKAFVSGKAFKQK